MIIPSLEGRQDDKQKSNGKGWVMISVKDVQVCDATEVEQSCKSSRTKNNFDSNERYAQFKNSCRSFRQEVDNV